MVAQAFEEAEADRHKFKARDPAIVLYGTPRLPKKAEQALTQPKSPKLSTDMRARARGVSLTREQLEQAGSVAFAARPVPATRTFELKPSVKVRRTALVSEPMRREHSHGESRQCRSLMLSAAPAAAHRTDRH